MKENRKAMRDVLHERKGFITPYFLAGMLLCSTLITISMTTMQNTCRTLLQLEKQAVYFQEEIPVLHYIQKCLEEEITPGEFICEEIHAGMDWKENGVTVTITAPEAEILEILTDSMEKCILDYSCER